jgi:hypothetical protein
MFANFKSHTPYQRKHFNQHLLPVDVASEFPFTTPSPSPGGRFPCDDAVPGPNTAHLFHCCLTGFDFISHGVFSFSAALFSGHDSRVRYARHARGCFLWVKPKLRFSICLLGNHNPENVAVATNWTCLGGQLAGVNDGNSMARKTIVGASST